MLWLFFSLAFLKSFEKLGLKIFIIWVLKDNFIKEFNIFDQCNIEFFKDWEKFDFGSFSFSTAHYSQIVEKFDSCNFLFNLSKPSCNSSNQWITIPRFFYSIIAKLAFPSLQAASPLILIQPPGDTTLLPYRLLYYTYHLHS